MRFVNYKFRITIVALLLAMPLVGATQALAQVQDFTPEAYTSELSGFDISVTGPDFAITDAELEHYTDGDGEVVTIESADVSLEVSFFDDEDSPEQSIDAYLSGLDSSSIDYVLVDRGESDDVTFAVTVINYQGVDILYYLQVTEDVVGNVDLFETILTGIDTFEADLASAQGEVSIDGAPFMDTVDAAGIIAAASDGSTTAETTPEASVSPSTTNSVTFENAGVDLEVSGNFEVTGDPITETDIQGHAITGTDTFSIVAVGETGMTATDTVDSFSGSLGNSYDGVEQIDGLGGEDNAWSLFRVVASGETRVMLVTADTVMLPGFEVLVAVEMPEGDVQASIEDVQASLAIDGQPLLATIDASEIADLVAGEVGDLAPTTPEATEESTGRLGDPREKAKLPVDSGTDNTSEVNTTPVATEEPSGQSDSSWEGPLFGHITAWDVETWTTDVSDPEVAISDEAENFESIELTGEFSAAPTYLYVAFDGDTETTPEDYLAYWTSDEYLNRETSSGVTWNAELVSSRSRDGSVAVVIRYTAGADEFLLIREAVSQEDGSLVIVTLDAPTADILAAYTAAQDGVTVDDNPVLTVISLSQIERLTAD